MKYQHAGMHDEQFFQDCAGKVKVDPGTFDWAAGLLAAWSGHKNETITPRGAAKNPSSLRGNEGPVISN